MQEEEINLRDYINVLIKRKRTILSLFFLSVIAASILSYLMPRIYRISMILEPPSVTSNGKTSHLVSPASMKAKIDGEYFNSGIIKALNLDSGTTIKFRVSALKGSGILKVSLDRKEKKIEDGVRILNQLSSKLSSACKTEFKKKTIEVQISAISSDVAAKNNEIKSQEEILRILEERKSWLINKIKETKSGKSKRFNKGNDSYLNQLSEQSARLKIEKEKIKLLIMNLQSQVEKLQIDIEKLNLAKEEIHDMKLIQEPTVSSNPIKPKKRQNIAIAMVMGLMLGVFIAFFREFWEKTGRSKN